MDVHLLSTFAAGTMLLAAGGWQGEVSTPAVDHVTLQLKWHHQFQFAGYYAAVARGYYREAGLEVRLLESTGAQMPEQAVLDGRADFGISDSELLLLHADGKPVVALATVFQHSPLILLASRAAGVNTVHDLVGKRVAMTHRKAEIAAYLASESIPESRITMTTQGKDPDTLIAGEVAAAAAYLTDAPFRLRQAGIDCIELSPRAAGIDFYGDVLYTTDRQVREHPWRVSAFREASMRGWQWALDHPEEMLNLVAERYSGGRSRAALEFEAQQMRRLITPEAVEIGRMSTGRWQHIADVYRRVGMLRNPVSLESFLYPRPPAPDHTQLAWTIAAGTLAVVSLAGAGLLLWRLRRKWRQEVDKRRRTVARLKSAEQRCRSLAEHLPVPLIVTSVADGSIRLMNARAAKRAGLTSWSAIGATTESLYADPADRDRVRSAVARDGIVQGYEMRAKDAGGGDFWVSLAATVANFEGESCVFATFTDISERKALEAHLLEASQRAEAANRSKSSFLANMSHEIRSPLNAIIGLADLLWDSPLDEEQREYVRIARTAGENLLSLLNDILDLSKVEAGCLEVRRIPFDLQPLVEGVIAMFGQRASERHVTLRLERGDDVPVTVYGDPDRLRQILTNLVGNAIKFTEYGQITVKTCVPADGVDRVEFAVVDTGIGIPADQHAHVFEPFGQTGDHSRKQGGVGLGLAICRELVERMDGRIWLDSTPGQGSTFRFNIQLPAAPRSEQSTATSSPGASVPDGRPMRILLAEDSQDNRFLVEAYLRGTNYQLDSVGDGEQALTLFKTGDYDLVLMDVRMPVMDGLEAARQIRAWENAEHRRPVPVLALSARAMQNEIEQAIEAGCSEHLAKPIHRDALLAAMSRHLDQSQASDLAQLAAAVPATGLVMTAGGG